MSQGEDQMLLVFRRKEFSEAGRKKKSPILGTTYIFFESLNLQDTQTHHQ
jgi:hypothetical protein